MAKTKKKKEKKEETAKKQADEKARLAKVTLIFDTDVIGGLKGKALLDQLDAYRLFGAPLPKLKKDVKLAVEKRHAIQKAIDAYNTKIWIPKLPDNEDTDNSQADEEDREDEEDPDE
jgi:hypothetical protein